MRTLEQHLAQGYDCYQHGVIGADKWKRSDLVDDLKESADLVTAVRAKVGEIESLISARGAEACHVSAVQLRILQDALRLL